MTRARKLAERISFFTHSPACMLEQSCHDIAADAEIKCTCQHVNKLERELAAYAAAENAEIREQLSDMSRRLGKPRCIPCNSVGITNCAHFDECDHSQWKYALEVRAEAAESREAARQAELDKLRPVIAHLAQHTEGELRAYVEVLSCRPGFGHAIDVVAALAPESKP